MKNKTKLLFPFAAFVALDQIAKYVFLNISICNKNLAWSISLPGEFFYVVWTIIVAGLIYFFLKSKNYLQKIFLILVFSGAASNMIDRIRFGCVVDYIDLKFFPVFNLADVYITAGILLFIICTLKTKCPA